MGRETGAIGLLAFAGRYGGTYAHRDMAFEFGSWLSPEVQLYLINEFQGLKEEEAGRPSRERTFQRTAPRGSANRLLQSDGRNGGV